MCKHGKEYRTEDKRKLQDIMLSEYNKATSILLSCILRYVLTDTAWVLENLVPSTIYGL